ncbi:MULTISPECIES: SURF1 family protein [unclassified Arthrobacter]|uniref:SURF1 family protein n=1 Tax=unclassified Arthrobacter TaxID=235627 RepID=UPI0024DF8E41|nr:MULTISPECIES: SURF1 family protein [unclassified Arthrobacter]MCC9144954.1 SURF1 family protein [Arthrobacter sp. zg-Y919]MDK1276182.1 SURF1 family protein [Arthrobacter sp. zg.Y919]WIB02479.1 SURF1 family protein [Arthrobacter sp. zg-Y919]
MLKTALQPRWIAGLLFALVISTVFVLLSQWQFSSAESEESGEPRATEDVRPLTEAFTPGKPMYETEADQMVSLTGTFDPDRSVLVEERLQDGEMGYWAVTAFNVDGAPAGEFIPVVRGWVSDPEDVTEAPDGAAAVVGRLLPSEAPLPATPEEGRVSALSTAELINLWDAPAYAAFVTATEITVDGAAADQGSMETVVVGAQPEDTPVNWLNIFYALEWIVFAGFSVFLWWRLVADEHRRSLEDDEYEDEYDDEYEDASEPENDHPSSEVTK